MALILTLTQPRGAGSRETRTVAAGTLSIGRAPGNDWVLADPERHLSKTHCAVSAERGRFKVTDLSTNGVFVNGAREPIGRDRAVELTDGDEFRLGEYVITATEVDDMALDSAPSAAAASDPFDLGSPPAPVASSSFGRRADPFAAQGAGRTDPLDFDPLDSPFGVEAAPFPPASSRPRAPRRAEDPFDAIPSQHSGFDDDDDLFRGIKPAESWQGPSQPDNVDAARQAYVPPKPVAPLDLDDFDALLGDTPPGQPAPQPAPVAPAPVSGAPVPIPPAPSAPFPTRSPMPSANPPVPAAAPVPEDLASLLAAFLEGAGVPDLRLGSNDPRAALRAAGQVFRVMVEGLRDVLMSRSALKNEMRVEQTMLRAHNNNALKFSVTPEEALAALLLPDRPGYMPALEAAREAFDDVRNHEIAVMAGVQTALVGLLRRFDPDALEQRLQKGVLDAILPAARKARFWELFRATYNDIAREAEDDFQSVFGREFARAYAAQTRKL